METGVADGVVGHTVEGPVAGHPARPVDRLCELLREAGAVPGVHTQGQRQGHPDQAGQAVGHRLVASVGHGWVAVAGHGVAEPAGPVPRVDPRRGEDHRGSARPHHAAQPRSGPGHLGCGLFRVASAVGAPGRPVRADRDRHRPLVPEQENLFSVCGAITEELPPVVRGWRRRCGTVHDRDINAAKNTSGPRAGGVRLRRPNRTNPLPEQEGIRW
ncbi:MAG TPA: zinc ribbon domain-containing protein [Mycobacteriales bacterium]